MRERGREREGDRERGRGESVFWDYFDEGSVLCSILIG